MPAGKTALAPESDFHIPFVVEVFLARQVISPLHFSQNRKIRGLVEIGVLVQGNNYNL